MTINHDLHVEPGARLSVLDDDLGDDDLSWAFDPPAQALRGPDRATLWVPSEETLINAGDTFHGPAPAPPLDAGISGRTRQHVHFHAMGAPEDGQPDRDRTIVRLGKPTAIAIPELGANEAALQQRLDAQLSACRKTDAFLVADAAIVTPEAGVALALLAEQSARNHAEYARLQEELETARHDNARLGEGRAVIGSVFHPPHDTWHGYSMITRGGAAHESRHNQVMVSGDGDLRLAGKRSVSVGSSGDVLIAVHNHVDVAEFCRNTGEQSDPSQPGPGKIHRDLADVVNQVNSRVASVFSLGYAAMNLAQGYNKTPMHLGKPAQDYSQAGWIGNGPGDYIGTIMSVLFAGLGELLLDLTPMLDTPGGRLDLYSSGSANIVAESSAKLHGLLYTSVGSEGATSVSGGQALSLSANGYASLSAPIVGVSAITKLSLESMVGPLTMRARSTIEISTQRNVLMGANEEIQMTSMENKVVVFGKLGFYLAGGGGDRSEVVSRFADVNYTAAHGFGIRGDSAGLFLGKVENVNKSLSAPGVDYANAIEVGDHVVRLRHAENVEVDAERDVLILAKKRIRIESESADVRVVASGRVLLGE